VGYCKIGKKRKPSNTPFSEQVPKKNWKVVGNGKKAPSYYFTFHIQE
jgi:hypothetical protein